MQEPTPRLRQLQSQRVAKLAKNVSSHQFFNVLTSDLLFDELEENLPLHRERLYPPTETLSMFLSQVMSADRSCQNAVNRHAIQQVSMGLPVTSTSTGGYCRARARLPLELVESLSTFLAQHMDQASPAGWGWESRRVRLVDGTTLTMPDTEENQAAYPQQGSQKPGLGFPICRVVAITSLETGALINAAVGRFNGKGGDEQTLLRGMWDSFSEGEIVLGDALYATYFFIASMQAKNVDLLLEQHGARRLTTDFRKGVKLGSKDHIITLQKPKIRPQWMSQAEYESAPNSLSIREFKSGNKVLITTMLDSKLYGKTSLAKLYKKRWNVELDIRNIKETLGMNILSCKTPAMILKEIWVYFLAYNLIRLLMAQSAVCKGIQPRQISFKHCLQIWLWVLSEIKNVEESLTLLMALIAQNRVGDRAGRIEPRAVKRRPKPYPLLMKRRGEAREDIRQNGHPKKLK